MDSKRLFILLTLLLLLICVLMENGEAFDRPPKRRRRRRFRRLKRCSRRRCNSGKKADDVKPLDMNLVSTILVGDQFYNIQYLFKIINCQRTYSLPRSRSVSCHATLLGEGKRKNEFAEFHVAWSAECHNYAK